MTYAALGKDAVPGNPLESLVVGFFGVGLEHQPLAGTPAPCIHDRMEALGEFALVVVRVAVGAQVEVTLGAAQRAEELAQILGVEIAVDHRRDHEGRVDDLAEAALLGKIIGAAEQ